MMKSFLNKLFERKNKNLSTTQIIVWWEIRRFAFNIIVLFSGILSLLLMSLVVKGVGDFISSLAIFGFAFLANLFYTGGWIVELFIKKGKNDTSAWATKSFMIGTIFSICCTWVPPIIFLIQDITAGKMVSSPYSHFASDKPAVNELAGSYQLDLQKVDYLSKQDILKQPEIDLKTDGTFAVKNFPIFVSFHNYDICNGNGKWQLDKHSSFNTWIIFVLYENLYDANTKAGKEKFGTEYFIYNNKPPYQIYDIVGDPDEWAAVLFKKVTMK
jgi:hypothetical protein